MLMYKLKLKCYANFYKNSELFGVSNYWKESDYYDDLNNLVICKMKDETFDDPV